MHFVTRRTAVRRAGLLALIAVLATGCTSTPTSPTQAGAAASLGSLAQGGVPTAPAGGTTCGGTGQAACPGLGATKFLAFGDSLTHGSPSSFDLADILIIPEPPSGNYPAQLLGLLRAAYPVQQSAFVMTNGGCPGEFVSGSCSGSGMRTRDRLNGLLQQHRPQVVLLLEGVNDLNIDIGIGATTTALTGLVDLARVYNATVLVATMFQTCPSTSPTGIVRENSSTRITAYNDAILAALSGRPNVHLVNLYSAFGTGNCTSSGGTGLLGNDGLHPTVDGYQAMATKFRDRIAEIFAVRGSMQ